MLPPPAPLPPPAVLPPPLPVLLFVLHRVEGEQAAYSGGMPFSIDETIIASGWSIASAAAKKDLTDAPTCSHT